MTVNEICPTVAWLSDCHLRKGQLEVRFSAAIGYDHFQPPEVSDIIMIYQKEKVRKFWSPPEI